jgi:DNA invertase Pin-like site-specific DNA recombinase
MKKGGAKVAVYYRVSTKKQAEKESIESQQLVIGQYLKEKGLSYLEFQDDGISGESINLRPGFKKLLDRIETGEFETLVVFATDRIGRFKARSDKTVVLETFENHLKAIYTYDGEDEEHFNAQSEDDMDTLEKDLTDARRENRRRAKKIRSGMKRARNLHRYASGRIPFGLSWDNSEKS